MIASTFVLSSSERPSSRHRSIVRQDSATLPRRDSVFQPDSGGESSPIPPVPPVPPMLASVPSNPHHTCLIKSGASTESEYPKSDSYMTSPETGSKEKTGPVPTRTRAVKNHVFDGPKTAVDSSLPVNTQGKIRDLSQEESSALSSDDHSLDEFIFVPPEPLISITSPGSDSSASYILPSPKRNDAKRKRRFGGSNFFVRNSCMIGPLARSMSMSDGSSQSKTARIAPLLRINAILYRQQRCQRTTTASYSTMT